jgi:hypothetical protein
MDIPAVAIAQLAKPDDEGLATLVVLEDHLAPPAPSRVSVRSDARPPFQPSCHDSEGTLIWNENTLRPATILAMGAAISGLISTLLFIAGKRRPIRESGHSSGSAGRGEASRR